MRQNTHFFVFLPRKATTQILPQNLTIIKPCALIFKAFLQFRRSADMQQFCYLFAAGDELHILARYRAQRHDGHDVDHHRDNDRE